MRTDRADDEWVPPLVGELGSASDVLRPALSTLKQLHAQWDQLPPTHSLAAHAIERHVSAVAQVCSDPRELERQASDANTAGEYLERFLSPIGQPNSPESFLNQGRQAEGNFQYQTALDAYTAALQLQPSNLVLTNAAGRTAYRLGDLKRAVELFYSAPKTALVSAAFELRITFLNNYASALRLSGSVVQAERIFNAALEELSPHRDVFGDLYSMVLNNIGVILTSRKDYTGADHIYRDAIDVRRNLHINDDLSLAQIHNNYAELKWRQGATRESKWLHAMALRTRLKVLGSVSLPVYESINNIGAIAREEKEYAAAEKCLRTTIDLAENLVGRRHFQYGSTLNNFGMLLASRGELEEALIYLKTAVEIIHASIMGGSPIEETVRQNLLNIEIAAAKDRVYGNTVKDSVILGSLTQESITGSRKERSMKAPQQKVSGSKIGGPVRLQSDVKVDQEFVKSSAASLDMIIRTKRGRERLSKSLERLAKSAEEKGEVPEEDARKLRDAADQARGGEMHKALTTLGSVSEKLVGFAEKIGASVAAKAIEHALQI